MKVRDLDLLWILLTAVCQAVGEVVLWVFLNLRRLAFPRAATPVVMLVVVVMLVNEIGKTLEKR